jgi:hypothetical protein
MCAAAAVETTIAVGESLGICILFGGEGDFAPLLPRLKWRGLALIYNWLSGAHARAFFFSL